MKKVLVLVISVALMLILCIDASASSNTYKVAELDLSIEFPSSYSVITRNISSYDPILNKLGVTKSELMTHFQSNNIYLNAISDNSNEEVVVTMVEDYLFDDFNLFSDSNISTIATALTNEYKNYGISVSKYEVYQHSQAKFIKIYFTDTAQTVHGLQYYTIYANKAMNFTMRSYTGTLSYTQEQTIKRIVDSIHFNTAPQKADVPNSTPAFTYTDAVTKVKFTVPANWTQKALSESRDYIDVKFVSNGDDGVMILYGSNDLWAQMLPSERAGYSRSDVDNSVFTNVDVAEMVGTSVSNIKKAFYNGEQYFQAETTTTSELYGYDFTLTMIHVIHVDNGWMYWFSFSGSSDDEYFSDFKALLNTVIYPQTEVDSSGLEHDNDFGGSAWVIVVVILAVASVVGGILFVIKSQQIKAPQSIQSKTATMNTLQYCRRCGARLPSGSEFCHKCGTKIIRE